MNFIEVAFALILVLFIFIMINGLIKIKKEFHFDINK